VESLTRRLLQLLLKACIDNTLDLSCCDQGNPLADNGFRYESRNRSAPVRPLNSGDWPTFRYLSAADE
jgi:hypothetical protein